MANPIADAFGSASFVNILEAFFSKPAVIGCVAVLALAAVGVMSIGYMIWSLL